MVTTRLTALPLASVAGAKKLKWNCGAALITSHHVLTAAHCVTQLGSRTEP